MSQFPRQAVSEKEFIFLVAFLMSIVAISIDALLPALGTITVDLALKHPNHAQFLIGFIFIGLAAGEIISGPLSDALGRKRVLYAGLFLFMLGSMVSYAAQDLTVMLTGRFIQGVGVSGPYVSAVSIVRDKYSGRQMARIMSLVMMIFIMVPAIAPALGQAILFVASWREIFILYVAYAAIIGLWLFVRLEETLLPESRIPFRMSTIIAGFKEVFRNRYTMSCTVCMGLCFGSFLGYLNSSQQIFQVQFGAGKMFAFYFGLLALVFGVASLLNSRFVERLGMYNLCTKSFICIIISSSVFLILDLSIGINLAMFLVYAAVLFMAFGLLFGNLNAMAMEPMGHIAGIASAIIGAVSSVISMALGAVIGQMYDNRLVPVVTGFLICGLLALPIMLWAHSYKLKAAAGGGD